MARIVLIFPAKGQGMAVGKQKQQAGSQPSIADKSTLEKSEIYQH